jgi:hypothetical protein
MLDVRFAQYLHGQPFPEDAPGILGVIGFGVAPGTDPRYGFPFAQVDIPVLGQLPFYEVWSSNLCITRDAHGDIESAHDGEVLFGVLQPEETAKVSLESTAYGAYLQIFDHVEPPGIRTCSASIITYRALPRPRTDSSGIVGSPSAGMRLLRRRAMM